METCKSKYRRGCVAFCKQVFLHNNSWSRDWTNMESGKVHSYQDCENMMNAYLLHAMQQQLWGKICQPQTCRAPIKNTEYTLHLLAELGWKEISWNGHILGLRTMCSTCVNVGLCPWSASLVPTQGTTNATTSTVPTRKANIRWYKAICRGKQHVWMSKQRGKNLHPRSHQDTSLLCTMCWHIKNTALRSLATQQANPTKNTLKKVKHLLDYTSRHPDTIITYHASNMVLAAHSDASYLFKCKSWSTAGEHFFISSNVKSLPKSCK